MGSAGRPRMPVLVDFQSGWPGRPLSPWPAVQPGEPYAPPQGRGRARVSDDARLASWTPVLSGFTPHGLRHGYQTWMDDIDTSYVLQSRQMGHEVPGMRGIYSHVTPRMLDDLRGALQSLWLTSLGQRATLSSRSAVRSLDAALAAVRGSQSAPAMGSAPRSLPESDI
jgi:hypothetical protein